MSAEPVTIVGCGYTGLRLARGYLAQDRAVSAFVRSTERVRELEAENIDARVLDLDTPGRVTLDGEGAFVYMAPPPAEGRTDDRVAAWLSMFRQAPRCIVYLSTTGVYGDCGGRMVDETTPANPSSDRGHRRLDAEQRLTEYAGTSGTALRILRVPGIYGPGRLPLERIASGAPIPVVGETGPGNRIHVDDLVRACRAAVDYTGAESLFNLGDGDDASMSEYFIEVARQAELEPPPQIPLDALLARVSPLMRSFLTESRRVDVTRMRSVLGVDPAYPDLSAGIAASLAEMQSG